MNQLDMLVQQLQRLARGFKSWGFTAAMLVASGVFLWALLIFAMADWALQLPQLVCWLCWVALVSTLGTVVWQTWKLLRAPLSPEHMAVRVEQQDPAYGNRLINVVQFARSAEAGDRDFAQALYREGPVELGSVRALQLFPRQILRYAGVAVVVALAGAMLAAALNPAGFRVALVRLLLPMRGVPPYSLTRIDQVTPGDTAVVKGQGVEVTVTFSGVIPKRPGLLVEPDRLPAKTVPLKPVDEQPGVFKAETPALFENAVYRVTGSDAQVKKYHIQVMAPPALVKWTATITPPSYTRLPATQADSTQTKVEVPLGSRLELKGTASLPLARVAASQGEAEIAATEVEAKPDFELTMGLDSTNPLTLQLTALRHLEAQVPVAVTILPDLAPTVDFTLPQHRLTAEARASLELPFTARDEYGVKEVVCELLDAQKGVRELARSVADDEAHTEASGSFTVSLADLQVRPGSRLRFRLTARDFGPGAETRVGHSPVLEVVVPLPSEGEKQKEDSRNQGEVSVAKLLQLQQDNLKLSRSVHDRMARKQPVPATDLQALLTRQVQVRDMAKQLLGLDRALGDLHAVLKGLVENEMGAAVAALDELTRAPEKEMVAPLERAIDLEVKILSVLKGMPEALKNEFDYQDKADLLATLQKLVATQKRNLTASKEGQAANLQGDGLKELVDTEERLADDTNAFLEAAKRLADEQAEDDFAKQLATVHKLLSDGQIYEKMLTAADQLSNVNWAAGIQTEEECLRLLAEALTVMNKWRLDKAKKTLAEASKTLKDISDQLSSMEERQQQIAEVTRDLTKRGELDDKVREELGKMDEEQKEWLAKLEKMAQDLYQFPELPVSNELNSKMREVFEDTEQAANSENAPAVEIAVQKEDGLLEAIKNTKERVEDVEMWLPDVPDNIKWDLESFDAAEFPEMPLVDLPEELEDIVGDLLDQSADIDAQSQDSTGNQMMADGEMGWGVMDGPMPNFSAKGKSGNTKPNDNEMTGRSGAGREGQATGELVENKVKGLEGRQTHARKTNDPLQKGQVEEEEGSTLDARATGGGKLGGESENIGMFGNAPRRDLHMQPGESGNPVRQETEALYATARLLYLNNTRELSEANENMRLVERTDKNEKAYQNLQQRVMKNLRDSHTELSSGAVLPLSESTTQSSGGSALEAGVDLDDVDESYRGMVSDYYKNLSE